MLIFRRRQRWINDIAKVGAISRDEYNRLNRENNRELRKALGLIPLESRDQSFITLIDKITKELKGKEFTVNFERDHPVIRSDGRKLVEFKKIIISYEELC